MCHASDEILEPLHRTNSLAAIKKTEKQKTKQKKQKTE